MNIGTADLASGLSILLLVLVIAGLVTAFSISRARRHGSTTLALDVTRNASFAWVLLMAAGAVFNGYSTLFTDTVFLDDQVLSFVEGAEGGLASPRCDAPASFPADAGPWDCGSTIDGVPLGPRLVLYLGTLLTLAASASIAWALYVATRRAGEREPFHPAVIRTFAFVSITVIVTAVLGQLLREIGMTLAAQSLDWTDGTEVPYYLSIPLWPFAVGVGFFALQAIFRYGAQLQRETVGLV